MNVDIATPTQANQDAAEATQVATVKPTSSKVSTWVNRVFVVVVLVAIPLLYYFGYMGKEWINRIGITLNFCAGFLVSPELLFRGNILIKSEQSLKTFMSDLQQITNRIIDHINNLFFKRFSKGTQDNIRSSFVCTLMCLIIYTE
jgi:hypothetical protein